MPCTAAPTPQSGTPGPQPLTTPEPSDGFRGPARTSPDQQPAPTSRNRTGDAVVDGALDELDALPGQPLDRHIEVGQRVHRTLQARLADIGRE